MIDTHCHIDMYNNPLQLANECEQLGIITIGMTNLPSHFELGIKHLITFKRVRLALGMHPLQAESHKKEFPSFIRNISKTSYIGEIGLDFSKEGIATKNIQLDTFNKILYELKGKRKILSIHSRKAEKEVLRLLIENNIKSAIFHWYSGPLTLIDEIVKAGFYFSINTAMIKSKSGQEIIKRIPLNHLLTESDGPFIEHNGMPIRPKNISIIFEYLSNNRSVQIQDIEKKIHENFSQLISSLSG
ncbi:TatD family hydrolase [Cytophaga aurantiaca]|uniref:TatD family hydrolase n=1 Tax=Cytophaga aurantiaca TaxID=29530 RepID=UPI0003A5FF49|nr:TatD family hydrolase [Cytophaga aurantiaca]